MYYGNVHGKLLPGTHQKITKRQVTATKQNNQKNKNMKRVKSASNKQRKKNAS